MEEIKVGEYLLHLEEGCERVVIFLIHEWWISHFQKLSTDPLLYRITIAPHSNPDINSYEQILLTPGVTALMKNEVIGTIPPYLKTLHTS